VEIEFIVDNNVGKLAKWLRMMGYDALLFKEEDDGKMIKVALAQNRVILTKDTQIMRRRLVTSGRLKAILIEDDEPRAQLRQIAAVLDLDYQFRPFSICLECNQSLVERDKDEVRDLVPPHVFETQNLYMECPSCHRIYWRGTHWQAMSRDLEMLTAKNNIEGGGLKI
jgi:uncharacterized protein with PIN domain